MQEAYVNDGLLLGIIITVLVFSQQNMEPVEIRRLAWEGPEPLRAVVLLAAGGLLLARRFGILCSSLLRPHGAT